jgi:hypothetical protein
LTAFRGAGWNHAISAIPHPPSFLHASDPTATVVVVHLDHIPLTSRTGYSRSPTYTAFLRSRLLTISLAWLTIDLLTTTIRDDPYFLLGPSQTQPPLLPLPPILTTLPWAAIPIPLLRNLAALAGIIAGLHLYTAFLQLILVFVPPFPSLLGARADLWQHPTLFGSFTSNVLDRGLPGFWGGWWHQTFRAGFVAPARWLLASRSHGSRSRSHSQRGGSGGGAGVKRAVVLTGLAFLQSGLLHAAGGYTSMRAGTVAWTPVAFFMLQAVGVLVQVGCCALLKRCFDLNTIPRVWRRVGNAVFVAVWLQLTGWGLIDDMSRAGLWLFEPVPASPLRMMGFGAPGESWWRWGGEYGLRWYTGRHWWESGIRL